MRHEEQFRLIETMRVSEAGEVCLLERHLERLSRSARYFLFECDLARIREEILRAARRCGKVACLRLLLSKTGVPDLEIRPFPASPIQRLRLSGVRVNSNDVFLYHKTTNREVYEQARRECDEQTDAILINERDEITETTIMNIAVLREGHWVTPQVSCGLLPGVMRAELLARGEIVEDIIHADELRAGEVIRCFNALRGTRDVVFKAD